MTSPNPTMLRLGAVAAVVTSDIGARREMHVGFLHGVHSALSEEISRMEATRDRTAQDLDRLDPGWRERMEQEIDR